LITYYVHRNGVTSQLGEIDPAWLRADSGIYIWADVRAPLADDAATLTTGFGFDPVTVENAFLEVHFPKVETRAGFLHVVLHGIDFQPESHAFVTLDIDFFLQTQVLVTIHDGKSRSIDEVVSSCGRTPHILSEGPVALMHRIVDRMVDHYRPEVDELEERLDDIEREVIEDERQVLTGEILAVKRDVSSLRRVVIPQRDIVGRLAGREFDLIDQGMAYRFRDVYDHLVRLADESIIFQDRVTGILDAHLASVSNRLAFVSKVLAAFAVIFGPLTVITGLFGMNVELPRFPGGDTAQFWWILGSMSAITAVLYALFKRRDWL
jgi:magnesium transporter